MKIQLSDWPWNVLSGQMEMHLLNLLSSQWSVCTFVTHVYVNDSIPVAMHKARPRDCGKIVGEERIYKWKIRINRPKVYKTGTFDIYVGLQEYRELLKVHHEGKLCDAMWAA